MLSLIRGADATAADHNEWIPSQAAAHNGVDAVVKLPLNRSAVQRLLNNKANILEDGIDVNTALFQAALEGCLPTVEQVLNNRASVQTVNNTAQAAAISKTPCKRSNRLPPYDS